MRFDAIIARKQYILECLSCVEGVRGEGGEIEDKGEGKGRKRRTRGRKDGENKREGEEEKEKARRRGMRENKI